MHAVQFHKIPLRHKESFLAHLPTLLRSLSPTISLPILDTWEVQNRSFRSDSSGKKIETWWFGGDLVITFSYPKKLKVQDIVGKWPCWCSWRLFWIPMIYPEKLNECRFCNNKTNYKPFVFTCNKVSTNNGAATTHKTKANITNGTQGHNNKRSKARNKNRPHYLSSAYPRVPLTKILAEGREDFGEEEKEQELDEMLGKLELKAGEQSKAGDYEDSEEKADCRRFDVSRMHRSWDGYET